MKVPTLFSWLYMWEIRKVKILIIVSFYFVSVVTIYATLGDEAIAHGINETEVTTVITTHDLLSKFRNILPSTPRVKTLIYIEDQIRPTDTTGFKDGITIISYNDVLNIGKTSKIGKHYLFKYSNIVLLII